MGAESIDRPPALRGWRLFNLPDKRIYNIIVEDVYKISIDLDLEK
jgi:hypothetical protein